MAYTRPDATEAAMAVVVVNHNTRELLRRCLEAIPTAAEALTVVVDTASRDGSSAMVLRDFPGVRVLETENSGYGAAANAGVRAVATPYVLLVNADVRLTPGALERLAAYLDGHPRAAVVGPRIVDERGRRQVTAMPFPAPRVVLLRESGLHRLLPASRKPEPRPVNWVLGAALALRRDAFQAAGGFDEAYFMYNEEVDLCLRLGRAGWETHYDPVATVVHAGGASTSQYRSHMVAEYVRSTVRLYRRHRTRAEMTRLRMVLGAAFLARILRDRVRLALARTEARRGALRTELAAWRAGLAALQSDLGK